LNSRALEPTAERIHSLHRLRPCGHQLRQGAHVDDILGIAACLRIGVDRPFDESVLQLAALNDQGVCILGDFVRQTQRKEGMSEVEREKNGRTV